MQKNGSIVFASLSFSGINYQRSESASSYCTTFTQYLCHWETWRPPRVLETLPPPTQKVRSRPVREWTARRFSTVWFWSTWLGTRGPSRIWTPALWGGCRRLLKATSRRWSREEWRAALSRQSWPVWAVSYDSNLKSPKCASRRNKFRWKSSR